jgi:GT2 family glycosyltransferase
MKARLTVVVLTYNRAHEVERTVERLLALPAPVPVVVADNGSDDDTVARLARRFPDVRIVECGANLGAAGRNLAVDAVETDYVAFSDDDTEWLAGSFEHAVRILDAAPRVAVLSGKVLVGAERMLDPTCARMAASPLTRADLPGPSLVGYMAGACVFRTRAFRTVGGYEPRFFIGGEEELVALDVLDRGWAIVYCDALAVAHCPSPARDARLRRRMLARNAALVAWMRLPMREAVARTLASLALSMREGGLVGHAVQLARDIGWALSRRRPVSRVVLKMRRDVFEAEAAARDELGVQAGVPQ